MNARRNFGGIDRFRAVAAILVIAIHTSPLESINTDADFFLTRILARVAVPFFFLVTGQFVLADGDKEPGRLYAFLRRTALLYGLAILLYLPLGIYAGLYTRLTPASALRMLLFDGPFYHLWYFPACILGILLLRGLRRLLPERGVAAAAAVLYAIGLFGDSYYGLTRGVPVISTVYDLLFRLFSYTRNGLFMSPLFLVMGAWIGRRIKGVRPCSVSVSLCGLIASLSLMTAESFTLHRYSLPRHDSMYLFLIPAVFFLYMLLLSCDCRSSRMLRQFSTWMYILHPAMIVAVRHAARLLSATALLVDNSLIHFLAVTALSAGVSALIARITVRPAKAPSSCCRAWIELDRNALRHNVEVLRSALPKECRLMPAVKADAYGHGAVPVARELNRLGVDAFCVACASEGVQLRRARVKGEILVLGYTHPAQFALLSRFHLTQTVIDLDYARALNGFGQKLHVHIGVDTGMHRLGERSEHIDRICEIFRLENLIVDGLFTHLCAADTASPRDQEYTYTQARAFYCVAAELKKRGFPCPKLHLQSSYGVLNYPELAEDYARVGIALYGVLSTGADTQRLGADLRPVLSLKARVASVRPLYAGESAGYGLAFTADTDRTIAAVAIGYADGLPRALSCGVGSVLINGHRAPVIGRICMDQTLVDVTDIPGVRAGDTAVLIGASGGESISVCDLAGQAGTITNELLSRLGARLERIMHG